MNNSKILFAAGILIATSAANAGSVVYVDDDAPLGGDGASWDTAYRFLQDSIADALGGGANEIRIAQGVYKPDRNEINPDGTGDRTAAFELPGAMAVMGGYAGIGADDPDARDVELYETTLSGDLIGNDEPDFVNNDENSLHVVTCADVVDVILDGVTVTAGFANGKGATLSGGGMRIDNSSVTILGCTFTANEALGLGGGMFTDTSILTFENCTFNNNLSSGVSSTGGGGLANWGSTVTMTSCQIVDNTALLGGGMANAFPAGGLDNVVLIDCLVAENTATFNGGGILNQINTFVMINGSIEGNEAMGEFFSQGGGMINQAGATSMLVNVNISGNITSGGGGGVNNTSLSDLLLINCTVTGNAADIVCGGLWNNGIVSDLEVVNSILWGNSDAEGHGESAQIRDDCSDDTCTVSLNYSCVAGLTGIFGGIGNIGDDPLFVDSASGNHRILSGSPCIDAADNTVVPIDINTDLDGNARFVDDPNTRDTGFGHPPIVDMGAYEFQPVICPWDLDSSGSVGTSDLLELFAQWGTDGPADFDESGVVNTADLLILFANWGPCP